MKKRDQKRGTYLLLLTLALCTINVDAQTLSADTLGARFAGYSKTHVQEKIYLHTDKDLYLSGEILWIKAYHVGSAANTPLDFSKVAYAELLDAGNKPVLQVKLSLANGSGNGSLDIPLGLPTGNYLLRAYTSWMKNFSPDYYFEKPITIINTLSKPEKQASTVAAKYDIQFFPEGGELVQGLSSKVAFRAIDKHGRGVDLKGFLVDSQNDTLARFSPLRAGIGSFRFTPLAGQSYRAVIRMAGQADQTVPIAKASERGMAMSLTEVSASQLKLSVQSNVLSDATPAYLIVHTRQETKLMEQVDLRAGKAELLIDKARLGEGISHLTLFKSIGQAVSERLYFKRPAQTLQLSIKTDRQQYARRELVKLDLEAKDNLAGAKATSDGAPTIDASVSVSISDAKASSDGDISTYLFLKSDLKGNIEDPAYYLNTTSPAADEALDNLMLTHGWRRFKWEDVIQRKVPQPEFLPELEGQIIQARIVDTRNNSPARNIVSYLAVPGKKVQVYGAESNVAGELAYYTRGLSGPVEIVAQTNLMSDSTYRIDIGNPFSTRYSDEPLPPLTLDDHLQGSLLAQSIANQVQHAYLGDKLRTYYAAATDTLPFYGKPDKTYLLDNFVRFNTMEEVLREYVYEVPVTRQRDDFTLFVSFKNHYNDSYKFVEPLMLLDGVPVFDRGTRLVKYDPKKVRSINVLAKKYYSGPLVFNSIIDFRTYKNTLPDFQLDKRATLMDFEGTQLQREFYSPVYETESQQGDRLPDFRTLLYWSPQVLIDQSGKKSLQFYTSDQKGKYRVLLEGLSSSGQPVSSAYTIEVR